MPDEESDGVEEVLGRSLHVGVTAAGQVVEHLSRARAREHHEAQLVERAAGARGQRAARRAASGRPRAAG